LSRKKAIGRAAGRVLLRVVILVVRLLPLPAGLALGRCLGSLFRRLAKRRYRTALKNLRIAYGNTLSQEERERIARESFKHAGMYAIEVIKFAYMSQEEVDRRIHVESGYGEMKQLLEHKKGALLITGHLGNFEIAGRWVTARGQDLIALAREARDQGTTEMMSRLRRTSGIQVVTLKQSLKPVLAGLRRNAAVAIVCDQNATDVFVPFFGRPTGTVDGPARLALRMGAPLLFFFCVRDGKGGYLIRSNGDYWAEPTGDDKADVERVTTVINERLEEMIRQYPEQWLWFHDRWKSSPPVEPVHGPSSTSAAAND
jgi:Kdo2-lipid IVA lauroyltransferase/acyltransferase